MKTVAIIFFLLIAVAGITFGYRAYKEKTEGDLAVRRSMLEERENELRRRAEATDEAKRLATLQAEQAAAEAQQKLAAMRQEEADAEARSRVTEAETLRLNSQLEELRRQKEATLAMVQKTAEQRQAELATIAATQEAALSKLRTLESEKTQAASREAALEAALKQQIDLEKQAQERVSRTRAAHSR